MERNVCDVVHVAMAEAASHVDKALMSILLDNLQKPATLVAPKVKMLLGS
jgi:hypothetical protein